MWTLDNRTKEIIDFYRNAKDDELIQEASKVCRANYGNKVFLRGLIEFSNYCRMNCLYCGIRRDNTNVKRYRLTKEEIIEAVKSGYEKGIKTFVLQSGEDNDYTINELCQIISNIKEKISENIAITLSCGVKTKEEYKALKNAGADRYLLRFETSDKKLHEYLRGGFSFEMRIKAILDLKELGYETGSGFMVGLPGETEEIRINNAILCKNLELDMVGIGPFIPHPDTPLKDSIQQSIDLTVRLTALVRLLLPEANIPATTAAGTIHKYGREKMLKAGANVLMPNFTPVKYKIHYLLYPGKICLFEEVEECFDCLAKRVESVGKQIVLERGDSISYIKKVKGEKVETFLLSRN